jgi:hypothetical protein
VWYLFKCLALALVTLNYGTEALTSDAGTWDREIVHFDLKPENGERLSGFLAMSSNLLRLTGNQYL